MKKQLKLILIIVLVTAVLALAWWGISLIPKDPEGVSSGVSQTVDLYEVERGNIASIAIKNAWGEYEVLSDGEGGFFVEEVKDYPQYTANMSSVVSAASNVTAKRMVEENATDLQKYGIESPKAVSVLTDDDGVTYKLTIGDEAPGGGYYFIYNDIPTVYTVSLLSAEALMYDPRNFVDVMLTESLDEVSYERIELSGAVREEPIIIVNMEGGNEEDTVLFSYDIISPGSAHLDLNKASEFLYGFSGMYADKAQVLEPTADELTEYGFDRPYSVAKFTVDGVEHTVTVGKVDGDVCYVMRDDRNIIYTASVGNIAWLDTQYTDLVSNLFLTPYIGDVTEVEVTFPEESYRFVTDYNDDDDLTVTYKGAKMEPENFKRFYQVLVNAYLEDYTDETATGEPVMTLTYTYRSGNTDKLELYTSVEDPRKVLIVLNGESAKFSMRYVFVEKVKGDVTNLFEGNEIVVDW